MISITELQTIVREASKLMFTDVFDITEKDGFANIVTSSDVAVQDFLCDRLSKAMPGCGFLCEEEDIHSLSKDYVWIIDPIDGTANYSRGIDQCSICVGLWHDGEMVMGVVYLPRTEEMFHAERGKGAYRNGKPIHVSDRPFANGVMCTALPVYHKEYAELCSHIITDVFMQCNDIRRFGACAPELCYLAMGRCDLYFEYLLSPWDFAAASLILLEAGGVIADLTNTPPTCLEPSGIIAANSVENIDKLFDIIQSNIE